MSKELNAAIELLKSNSELLGFIKAGTLSTDGDRFDVIVADSDVRYAKEYLLDTIEKYYMEKINDNNNV